MVPRRSGRRCPWSRTRAKRCCRPADGRKLLVGGAGAGHHAGWITIDLARSPGVTVLCSVEALPFRDGAFAAIECDAVLEHVAAPQPAIEQLERVLAPGGHLHVVVPFNHPFHEYPADYQRWTVDGLRRFLGRFEVVEAGVRTGPTATLLTFVLEYVKLCAPRPAPPPRLRRRRLAALAPPLPRHLAQPPARRPHPRQQHLRPGPQAALTCPSRRRPGQ